MASGPGQKNYQNYISNNNLVQESMKQNEVPQHDRSIEQEFDKFIGDMRKYDEILGKIAKSIDEVSAEEYFITDFYPNLSLQFNYQSDRQKQFIKNQDMQLGKAMQNLERTNRNLKQQIRGWMFEFAKKTRLSEVLLTENKLLRRYVSSKNQDIVKIIQAIKNAENQDLKQLNETFNELKQQNGLLNDHLKQIKQKIQYQSAEEKRIMENVYNIEKEKQQIERKIKQGQDHQDNLSKKVALLESSLLQVSKRKKKLEEDKERLIKLKEEYERDERQISEEANTTKNESKRIDQNLRKQYEKSNEQKQRLLEQISTISDNITSLKQQVKNLDGFIKNHEFKIEEYTTNIQKLEQKQQQMKQTILKNEEQLNKLKEVEVQQLSVIQMINFDIQIIKEELKQLQILQESKKQFYKAEWKKIQVENKLEIGKLNEDFSRVKQKNEKRVAQQKTEIFLKKKEIQGLESRIANKKAQIQDLKQQFIEVKQNQAIVANLKNKLRETQMK